MPRRILHIGAGAWSRFAHAPVLARLAPRVELTAICDLEIERAKSFQREFGYAQTFTCYREAIRTTEPNLIYCTVQPQYTFDLVRELLPLGIALFIEKPPGISLHQACDLARLSAHSHAFAFVAFNRRHIPGVQRLKTWTKEHRVRIAQAEMLRHNRLEPHFAIETAIHAFDCLRFLLGDASHIAVSESPSGYLIQLQFRSDITAQLAVIPNCGLRRERYMLHSDRASAEAVLGAGYSSPFCLPHDALYESDAALRSSPESDDPLLAGGFLNEHLAFLNAVENGTPSPCSLEDAMLSMQLAECVQNGFSGPLPSLRIIE